MLPCNSVHFKARNELFPHIAPPFLFLTGGTLPECSDQQQVRHKNHIYNQGLYILGLDNQI